MIIKHIVDQNGEMHFLWIETHKQVKSQKVEKFNPNANVSAF